MLETIHPKLPMRDKNVTVSYYTQRLGFSIFGNSDYPDYLMLQRDHIQIHFFLYKDLDPLQNYGQVYIRTEKIDLFYSEIKNNGTQIHPNGDLRDRPWGQREFSLLDPDNNLLTFGQSV